jgi:outer membrane protein assembly factor BamA
MKAMRLCSTVGRHALVSTIITVVLLVGAGAAVAQAGVAVQAQSEPAEPTGGNTLVPFPVLFQQPETGTGFGAAAVYYFRPSRSRLNQSAPSAISAFAAYTTHKQVITELGAELYLDQNRLRVNGGIGYEEFPTTFWGIGNDVPSSAEAAYTPRSLGLELSVAREFAPSWYWGVGFEATHRRLAEVESGGKLSSRSVPGAADGRVVGLGVGLVRDTRDNTVYPRNGGLYEFSVARYDGVLGSDHEYTSVTLDMRQYQSPLQAHVLAIRLLGETKFGNPPFDALPELGGDELLRGYYGGRFRDKNLVAFQAEYRIPVFWRFGIVGFAEAGQVADALNDMRFSRTKVSAGGGLRFLLSPKEGLALRLDYGWGFDTSTSGFYISLGEAF